MEKSHNSLYDTSDSDEDREEEEQNYEDEDSGSDDTDWTDTSFEDSGEARLAETEVKRTERCLTTKVDDSIWDQRAPSRVKTWKSSAVFLSQRIVVHKIHLTPLVNQWYKDVLVIPHNSIKMELMDLYKMIRSFEMYRNKLRSQDVARFYTWFDLTQKFIQDFLELDEELIMKPVDSIAEFSTFVSISNRQKAKQAITDTFTIINSYRVHADVLKDDDNSFAAFVRSCRILAQHIAGYIAVKEKHVPPQIHDYSNEKETMEMQDQMIMRLRGRKNDGEKFYLLYVRDLDVKTVKAWNKKYLKWVQRHMKLRTWRRRLRAQHYNLVEQICRDVGDPGNSYLPGST